MPANNRIDVRIFVERTINYETTSPIGPWHKRLLMLAGSDLRFHSQTNRLISRNQLSGKYETERIYAPHTDEPNFDERIRSPIARRVIDSFNDGASVVNYIGHGGGGIWSSSRMLDFEDPEQNLTNISQLPLVISMTCYTGSLTAAKIASLKSYSDLKTVVPLQSLGQPASGYYRGTISSTWKFSMLSSINIRWIWVPFSLKPKRSFLSTPRFSRSG